MSEAGAGADGAPGPAVGRVPFLDLGAGIAAERAQLDAALARVLDAGWLVLGPTVESFERAFAAWCGAGEAVGVASGTDAIELALRAVGVGAGDEVVTCAATCVPTVAAIERAGAVPVLVDCDPATATIDPEALRAAVGPRTRAVVPVHLYGQCADMGPILAIAREHGLRVVEDAAQAHGAEWEGRRAGSIGDAAAFSFYPTKNLGALGDGGAVTSSDPAVAARVRLLRTYGERARYESVEPGVNSRLDALQAAVLETRLAQLDAGNDRRRALAAIYAEELAGAPLALPVEAPGRRHVYHLYVVRIPGGARDRVRAALAADGVETLVHYPRPVHGHPAYARLARPGCLPASERLAAEALSLPLHPLLGDDEARRVAAALRAALAAVSG